MITPYGSWAIGLITLTIDQLAKVQVAKVQ